MLLISLTKLPGVAVKLRQLLNVRTFSEFLVDFEIEREQDIPMEVEEFFYLNSSNKDFYTGFIGSYKPCILRNYLYNFTNRETINSNLLIASSDEKL